MTGATDGKTGRDHHGNRLAPADPLLPFVVSRPLIACDPPVRTRGRIGEGRHGRCLPVPGPGPEGDGGGEGPPRRTVRWALREGAVPSRGGGAEATGAPEH